MSLEDIKNNPVRLYAIFSAALALLVHYVPDLPLPLILGLAAAILGTGEAVRATVTPVRTLPPPPAPYLPPYPYGEE